jgi:ribonuclease P protein component
MARAGRLTSAADFRRTYISGRRASTRSVVVHVNATGEDRPPRVGVSAGRAVGGAVQRNRAKRRLRAAVETVRPKLAAGQDVVLVATPVALIVEFQELADSVANAISKVSHA